MMRIKAATDKLRVRQAYKRLRYWRRASQILFFLLFLLLFFSLRDPYEPLLPADAFLQVSPLVTLTTLLTAHRATAYAFGALLLLLLSILFGRFFCGWICPMGTAIDAADSISRSKRRRPLSAPRSLASLKYLLLLALLAAAAFSFQWAGLFDPLVLLTRSMTAAVFPLIAHFIFAAVGFLYKIGLASTADILHSAAQKAFLPPEPPVILHGLLIAVIFVAVLALGYFHRRFWCRYLCPLGALFGLFARLRRVDRHVDETCTECGLCARRCRMNAVDGETFASNSAECIVCGDCAADCASGSIRYRWGNVGYGTVDLSRRRAAAALLTGVFGAGLIRFSRVNAEPAKALRPPGVEDEEDFMRKCVRCQACVQICSSSGGCLQPSLLESGVEGFWTPVSVPRLGYCEYNCSLCGHVCPTGAIPKLPLEEKQKAKIGTAAFDRNVCIPWRRHTDCLVCEEHCPLPEKAIRFQETTVLVDGSERVVKLPFVVEELCIGCGICENKCPVNGPAGIRVLPRQNTSDA